jgi:dihydrofolate reductase
MISLVVAAARNNVIGKGNALPWSLPNDLKHFREVTSGHTVVMGRKTFESIGRPLPNRRNIVITRQEGYKPEGVEVVGSLAAAIASMSVGEDLFVIGGGEIFNQVLPIADRVYLTRIEADVEGDAFFPRLDANEWEEVSRLPGVVDEKNALPHTFLILDRIM